MTESEKEFLLSLFDFNNKLSDNMKIKIIYSLSNNTEKNYKIYKIKKKNGKTRTVYEPNYYLKNIQRNILNKVLYDLSPSLYSNAYCKNRNVKDNAIPHLNKKYIIKLDIKNFFDNLNYSNVYQVYSIFGFSKRICSLLTSLSTYNEILPQGAPTSAYLSNIVLRDFDYTINNWCKERNINYTRYSDDMTFSMDVIDKELIRFVRTNLYKFGLEINNEKICVINSSKKQKVTGVVVNNKIQADIKYRKKIRQEMYFIKNYGIDSHLKRIKCRDNKEKYLHSLLGRINYVNQLNENNEFHDYKKIILNLIRNNKGENNENIF